MDSLAEGKLFDTYTEFLEAKSIYEKANYIIIVMANSTKLKPNDSNCQRLVNDRAKFVCKAGKPRVTQSKGIRKTSTEKLGCTFELQIAATTNNKI